MEEEVHCLGNFFSGRLGFLYDDRMFGGIIYDEQ
ncbi:MAG: hypothetical protein M2R45_01704 [Verrucomicrobia subdivision 3 bacterium]|nr:hypothetical protein [Limisphaerales bacterium]MCS1413443.1 hypothetical protein [Limisphaerales bacterium]